MKTINTALKQDHEVISKEKSLNEKSLKEILQTANETSLKLKNPKKVLKYPISEKEYNQISSAEYSDTYEDYLKFEKAGD
jgi:hypothetical protein